MKKLLFLSLAAIISFGAMAQHDNHNNGKNKKQKHEKKHNKKDHDDDDRNGQWNNDDSRRRDNNDRWDNQDNRRNDNRGNNSNSGNLPRRVSDAFARDYPNATNVTWTKDRGVWSARFRRSGIFGGNNTVSYSANGQRVNNNSQVYNNNDNRNGQQGNSKPNRIFGQ